MTFAEKIRKLRRQKGKSQEQVSREIGIAISSLRNYENGRMPDTVQLKLIKEYYHVTYEYLLDDAIENLEKDNIDIGKELGLSDITIKKVKYLKEGQLQSDFNFFLEYMPLYGVSRNIKMIKHLTEEWISNICFLVRLYDYIGFFKENINKKTNPEISKLFELFDMKMLHFYKFIEENDYLIDFISLEECKKFRESLQKVQNAFILGEFKKFHICIAEYTDMCCSISEKIKVFIDFSKYTIQNMINNFLQELSPDYRETDLFYYKELKDFYKYSENGFSENQIKQFEKSDKKDYIYNNILYVKSMVSYKEDYKNIT